MSRAEGRTPGAYQRVRVGVLAGSVLLAAAMVLVTGTPTMAAVVTVKDSRTDAAKRFNLIRVKMVNADVVSVSAKVADLRAGRQYLSLELTPETSTVPTYVATTRMRKSGKVTAALQHVTGGSKVGVACAVLATWQVKRNVVRLSFPQSCLAEHGSLLMQAKIGRGKGTKRPPVDVSPLVRVAYRADTTDGGTWGSGTVAIRDDAPGTSGLFQVDGLSPGATGSRCILLTYEGSLAAQVRVYAAATGDLAPFLDLTVEQGDGGSSADCAAFVPEATVYEGTLRGFADASHDFATGAGDWRPTGAGQQKAYRFTYRLQDDNAAQGLDASATFTWEAQG